MGENQVSVDGERRSFSGLFFVIATENPVEFRGTYPLPEAQMDRFAMEFTLGYVEPVEEVAILTAQEHNHPLEELNPCASLAMPGPARYQQGGVGLASSVGQSEEFVSLRDYRRGDPLRHIHWRSWAKVGRPIVKEFEDEYFVRHALVPDTFSDLPQSEAFEEAVSVAASFACALPTQESLLDLLFVGAQAYCFTTGRGVAQADHMLEILASVRLCTDKPFQTLETLVLNHARMVSGCVCVFLAWDEARRRFVEKLKAVDVPVLVVLITSPGQARWEPGPLRDEPENFRVLETGRVREQLAK
jgi:hypothetical protein